VENNPEAAGEPNRTEKKSGQKTGSPIPNRRKGSSRHHIQIRRKGKGDKPMILRIKGIGR